MNPVLRFFVFLPVIILVAACWGRGTLHAHEGAHQTIILAADEWCPINCLPEDGQEGIAVELARRIYEAAGYEVDYRIMPWARALEAVRDGSVHAAIGASREDDASLVYPETPLFLITDDFYVLRENPLVFENLDSIRGKRLGSIRDYGYSQALRTLILSQIDKPGLVQEVGGHTALEQNIKKLLAGRVEVVVETRSVMEYTLQKMQVGNRIKRVGQVEQGYAYLGFSPARAESKRLADIFDAGMERLKADGSLEDIYQAYGLDF